MIKTSFLDTWVIKLINNQHLCPHKHAKRDCAVMIPARTDGSGVGGDCLSPDKIADWGVGLRSSYCNTAR